MNWRVKKLLLYLHFFDKVHQFKLPRGIGKSTADWCIEQGFIQTKRFDRKREGCLETYRIGLRITKKGIRELKKFLFEQATL